MAHNETALLRIASWSKVTGWVIAVLYVISWISDLRQMLGSDAPIDLLALAYPVAMGVFYWLVMQGLAQGLYLGLDLFAAARKGE